MFLLTLTQLVIDLNSKALQHLGLWWMPQAYPSHFYFKTDFESKLFPLGSIYLVDDLNFQRTLAMRF